MNWSDLRRHKNVLKLFFIHENSFDSSKMCHECVLSKKFFFNMNIFWQNLKFYYFGKNQGHTQTSGFQSLKKLAFFVLSKSVTLLSLFLFFIREYKVYRSFT